MSGTARAGRTTPGVVPAAAPAAALARVRVVLVGTTHPGNVGAVARAMKTMGLRDLALVAPRRFPCADATARAAGADDLLARAVVCADLDAAIADCGWVVGTTARPRHVAWPEVDVRGWAERAVAAAGRSPVAVVFGRESSGLTNAELDRCHAIARVPCDSDFRSLNLAAAVQVFAYEARLAALGVDAAPPAPPHPGRASETPATAAELEGLYRHLERALADIGYAEPSSCGLLMRRLRRLFARAGPNRGEVDILRGVLNDVQRLAGRARGSDR